MHSFLFYIGVCATGLAILFYLFAGFFSLRYLTCLSGRNDFVNKTWGVVLHGSLFNILSIIAIIAFAYHNKGVFWDEILIVNFLDLLLSAAFLHTVFWKWKPTWSAWIAIAIIIVDALARFTILVIK